MPRVVKGSDGRAWRLRRMWLPRTPTWVGLLLPGRSARRPKEKRSRFRWYDIIEFPGDESLFPILIGVIALAGLFMVGVPLLIFVFDLLLLAVALVVLVVLRVLFRRPWIIEAATDGPPPGRARWPVSGWARSGRAIELIASRIRSTGMPPQELPRV